MFVDENVIEMDCFVCLDGVVFVEGFEVFGFLVEFCVWYLVGLVVVGEFVKGLCVLFDIN